VLVRNIEVVAQPRLAGDAGDEVAGKQVRIAIEESNPVDFDFEKRIEQGAQAA
jgi:hypothetical protein